MIVATTTSLAWLDFLRKHIVLVAAISVHILSIGGLVYANQAPPTATVPVTVPAESAFPKSTVSGIPTEISVPSVGVKLTVEPGAYNKSTDSWTLSGYNAHFATITRPANDGGGNTFIYGHNNRHVFGPMKAIIPGAEARITTDVGNTFYYSLVSSRTVDPSDVSVFTYTGAPILTIQTCTGIWHERRELYTFKLERVEESQRSVAIRTEAERKQVLQTVAAVASPTFSIQTQPIDENSQEVPEPTELDQPPSKIKPETDEKVDLKSLIRLERPLFSQMSP